MTTDPIILMQLERNRENAPKMSFWRDREGTLYYIVAHSLDGRTLEPVVTYQPVNLGSNFARTVSAEFFFSNHEGN